MWKDTVDRLLLGYTDHLSPLIANSIPYSAWTVVRSIETVSLLWPSAMSLKFDAHWIKLFTPQLCEESKV
jgi:hypothetical protein